MPSTADVQAWFRGPYAVVDDADVPRGRQLELLTEIADLYERLRLVDGGTTPELWHRCPRCSGCWAGAEHHRPEGEDRGGISLPWVGPGYEPGGVVIVGMNLRDAGGLLREFEISAPTASDRDSQWARLAHGHREAHGSSWAYRSLLSGRAVSNWLLGQSIDDRDDPRLLTTTLERSARLQAVKCSPADGDRSTPTPAMVTNCPPLLLAEEIKVLTPGAVVGFGLPVYEAFGQLGPRAIEDGNDYLAWGSIDTEGRRTEVFWLYHPAGRYWARSHEALLEQLRARH